MILMRTRYSMKKMRISRKIKRLRRKLYCLKLNTSWKLKLLRQMIRLTFLPNRIKRCRHICVGCEHFKNCYGEIFNRDWWE